MPATKATTMTKLVHSPRVPTSPFADDAAGADVPRPSASSAARDFDSDIGRPSIGAARPRSAPAGAALRGPRRNRQARHRHARHRHAQHRQA